MKLDFSVWSNYLWGLEPERRIDTFLAHGFNRSEFSDEDGALILERGGNAAKQLRSYADSVGFSYPQGHLYLRVDICADGSVDTLKRWLDMFNTLGIRSAVLHAAGGRELEAERRFEKRVGTIRELSEYIDGSGMTICLENLMEEYCPRTSGELNALIDAAGGKNLGICLDTGHLNVVNNRGVNESQSDFISAAGARLKALHIADNDGSSDMHLMPYGRGRIDWQSVMTALAEVGYDRLYNLEIPGESRAPLEVRELKLDYIKRMCEYLLSIA